MRARSSLVHTSAPTELLEPIQELSHSIIRRLKPFMASAGLAPSTFWPLHHLDRAGVVHPGDLARWLGATPATCTATIDQLVELGLVRRSRSETDRRQVELQVTPQGHKILETVWRNFDGALREGLAGVPAADVAATVRTMRTLSAQMLAAVGGTQEIAA
jgi:DNA-binding MarR family transcriptional regulator